MENCLFQDVKWKATLLGLAFLFAFAHIQAQKSSQSLPIFLPKQNVKFQNLGIDRLLPNYVQENPQDLAPLCRMELKIERKSPIGMWLRIDDNATRKFNSGGLAYLRFRWTL